MKKNTTFLLVGACLVFFFGLSGNAFAKKKSNSKSEPVETEIVPPPFVTNSVKGTSSSSSSSGNSTVKSTPSTNNSGTTQTTTSGSSATATKPATSTTSGSSSTATKPATSTTSSSATATKPVTSTTTTSSSKPAATTTQKFEKTPPVTITTSSGARVTSVNDKIKVDYNGKCTFVGEDAKVEFYLTNNSGKIIEEFYMVGSCSADDTRAIDDKGNEYVVNVRFGNSGGNCYIADSPLLKSTPVKVILTIEKANRKNMSYFSKITIAGRTSVYAYDPPRNEYQGVFILENVVPKKEE